jgi:hypothetical protein
MSARQPSPNHPSAASAPVEIDRIWTDAFHEFREKTGVDVLNDKFAQELSRCSTSDGFLLIVEREMKEFEAFRGDGSRWGKVRSRLKPFVEFVLRFNDVAGEAIASVVRTSSFPSGILLICF